MKKQKENKLKTIGKDKIVYLEDKINKLFEIYPKYFTSQSKTLLRKFAENKSNINYKNLSYKFLLLDG